MLIPAQNIGKPIIPQNINNCIIKYKENKYKILPRKGEFRGVYEGYAFYYDAAGNFMVELKTGNYHKIPYRGELIVYTAGIKIVNEFISSQFKIID